MPPSNPTDFLAILHVLCAHHVDFIVVGGIGAVLEGAPINTFDLDVVHSREESNVARLRGALLELDAIYRAQPERRLRPGSSHLFSNGHRLLMTKFGPLDVLGAIGAARDYAALLPSCVMTSTARGCRFGFSIRRFLSKLIKAEVGAPKDAAVLPVLRRTLEERSRDRRS